MVDMANGTHMPYLQWTRLQGQQCLVASQLKVLKPMSNVMLTKGNELVSCPCCCMTVVTWLLASVALGL